jgi:hypothetical protein
MVLVGLKPIRWGHVHITRSGDSVMSAAPEDLREWLSTPVGGDRAVLVQTNRQKRSVLSARWGAVATCHDGVAVLWGAREVGWLAAVDELRWDHGFSEVSLREAAPRPGLLAAASRAGVLRRVMDLWLSLRDAHDVWWEIAVLATRRSKGS